MAMHAAAQRSGTFQASARYRMRFSTGISPVTVELDVLSDVPGEVGVTLAVLAMVKPP
jgi:hypothetical protein